jgi:hypothetical protein
MASPIHPQQYSPKIG